MLRLILTMFFLGFALNVCPQTFTWIQGSDTKNPATVYGTKGIGSVANTPGQRLWKVSWVDLDNNLWLFGNLLPYLNDLWKYNIASSEWTWMKGDSMPNQKGIYGIMGIPDSANTPGARWGSATWTDNDGNLWLFGGGGYDWLGLQDGGLNDLWKYDPLANKWTWMKGSKVINQSGTYGTQGMASANNIPGARVYSATWKDNAGNLWLFGGGGYDAFGNNSILGDLWKYDILLNQWIWVSGNAAGNRGGTYGTQGIPSASNIPGARTQSAGWMDIEGNFWMFGGDGYDSNGNRYDLNDLWKYNLSSNEWVWVKGSSISGIVNAFVYYGTKGKECPQCTPGARYSGLGWADRENNLWFFGGDESSSDAYNDLWRFSIRSGNWAWVKGSQIKKQLGVYGTRGVSAISNIAGSRSNGVTWIDTSGIFWLYGGVGQDAYGAGGGILGDLWKLTIEPLVIDSQSLTRIFCTPQSTATIWVAASGRETIFYQWYKNGSALSTAENDSFSVNDINPNDVYWCMVYDVMDTIYSIPVQLAMLNVSATVSNHLVCFNSNDGEISINAQGGFGTLSYSIDGINYQSSGIFSGLPAGTYAVYAKDSLGFVCTETLTLSNPSPFIIETITKPVTDSSAGSVRIKILSGGVEPYAYSFDGSSFQDSSIFYGLSAGAYIITLRDSLNCEDTVHVQIATTVGLLEQAVNRLIIYPNPFSGKLSIETTSPLQFQTIEIFDMNGDKLIAKTISARKVKLNVQHLPNGLYFYRILLSTGEIAEGKIVKQ